MGDARGHRVYLAICGAIAGFLALSSAQANGLWGLMGSLLAVGMPIFVPLALVAGTGRNRKWAVMLVGAVVIGGWCWMMYEGSRPYLGGGASFSVFLLWGASFIASVAAFMIMLSTRRT